MASIFVTLKNVNTLSDQNVLFQMTVALKKATLF
jgi:hypothetical protein